MKKTTHRRLRLGKIKIASLSNRRQMELKGGLVSTLPCIRPVTYGRTCTQTCESNTAIC